MARANKEAFTKEIGSAPSYIGIKFKFEFHSGNAHSHYLAMTICTLGSCSMNSPMYFDAVSAKELLALFGKLKAGQPLVDDVGDKYN